MPGRLLSLFAVTTLVAGLSSLAGAPAPKAGESTADWPQFRGPKRDNISPDKGLLKRWPKDGPKLAWKAEGIGKGVSSVAVVGKQVFTMGEKDGSTFVFALDRADGTILWSTKVGEKGGSTTPGPRSTPTVDGKFVYALGQLGDLVCLDTAKGEEQWRRSLVKDFAGNVGSWNYCESPLIDGDRLVCTPGGAKALMVVLEKLSGKEIWRTSGENINAEYSSIVISNAGGVKQYVQLTRGGTIGVAAKDGTLLWRYERLANNTANVPTPIVLGDQIFTTAGYGKGGALLTITKVDSKREPKQEYYNEALKNKHGGVTIVGNSVYGDTDEGGRPFCARWKTGEVVWTRQGRGKGQGSAAITYADGNLYVRYNNGWVALVPATPKGYTEMGSFKIPNSTSQSWSHPVVIGGKLYLREKDIVWCYDVKAK